MRIALTRRKFLGAGAAVVGALAMSRIAQAAPDKADDAVAELGNVKDLNEKEPQLVNAQFKDKDGKLVAEKKVYVRWDAGSKCWVVLSAICTHLKCKVEYKSDLGYFKCPCHKSEFELNGEVRKKPAKKPLPDYSDLVSEEGDKLMLKLP